MIYNDNRVRMGTVTHCGYFVINTILIDDVVSSYVGRITAGSQENCGATQECQWSTIKEGLNNYVGDDNAILKRWIVDMEDRYPSVLDFGN